MRFYAKSYALATQRRIPLPLKGQVEEELKCMEALGVIRKVDVPKSNNKVHICVDLIEVCPVNNISFPWWSKLR